MKILRYDDELLGAMTPEGLVAYKKNTSNYANARFRPKQNPGNAWALPYLTGKKYKIHWSTGLDFTSMQILLSEKWLPTDKPVYFVMNYTDAR